MQGACAGHCHISLDSQEHHHPAVQAVSPYSGEARAFRPSAFRANTAYLMPELLPTLWGVLASTSDYPFCMSCGIWRKACCEAAHKDTHPLLAAQSLQVCADWVFHLCMEYLADCGDLPDAGLGVSPAAGA